MEKVKISDYDNVAAVDWFTKHNAENACAFCGKSDWNLSESIYELNERGTAANLFGGGMRQRPIALLTCSTCGYTMMFNAMVMGLVKKPESEKADTETPDV